MQASSSPAMTITTATCIADAFVTARLQGRALTDFPGPIPADLAAGYACQDLAIARWPDRLVGWKVGYIAPAKRDASGDDRVTGPVFGNALWPDAMGTCNEFPIFIGGFAAVEAEYVFRLAADAPPHQTEWTAEEAAALVGALHIGVETAGSPLATINVLGPSVVAADFGNNAGLILGAQIVDWQSFAASELICETRINGIGVGTGGAASIAGGLLGALAFALGRCARRGHALRAGCLVTTGAATGIHDIRLGDTACIDFGRWGSIQCRPVAAQSRVATSSEVSAAIAGANSR
ncbi:MAG: 2-keto-4-pentenoate hydratase [Pseudomarimonas sp.]